MGRAGAGERTGWGSQSTEVGGGGRRDERTGEWALGGKDGRGVPELRDRGRGSLKGGEGALGSKVGEGALRGEER